MKAPKVRNACEKALFVGGLFKQRVERDKTKFKRHSKHRKDYK